MATIAEQLTSLANTKTAIKNAIVAKGVAVADTEPFSAYAGKIGQISGGGGGAPATKFGVSIDDLLGDVDENGTYYPPQKPFTVDFSRIKRIGNSSRLVNGKRGSANELHYMFYGNIYLSGTVDLSGLKSADFGGGLIGCFAHSGVEKIILPAYQKTELGLEPNISFLEMCDFCPFLTHVVLNSDRYNTFFLIRNTFSNCENLTKVEGLEKIVTIEQSGFQNAFQKTPIPEVDLSSLKSVGASGMVHAFQNCKSVAWADLRSLETVDSYGLQYAFDGCESLSSVNLSSLQTLVSRSLSYAFQNCVALTSISFPALTSVHKESLGSSTSNSAFSKCTALTEIHFRADMQATIEAMSQYANKWGATNATIYFDL